MSDTDTPDPVFEGQGQETTIQAWDPFKPPPPNEHTISAKQYEMLRAPLRSSRVAKRSAGGKQLSYLESWDVRAHLIRVFGYGNFDVEVTDPVLLFERDYRGREDKAMIEVGYRATVTLRIRNEHGYPLATYTECAVGQASVGADNANYGDIHDNALKTAASDALKRCAINLGTQFGLSLYDDGRLTDVVKVTLVTPAGVETAAAPAEAVANVEASLGGQVITEEARA